MKANRSKYIPIPALLSYIKDQARRQQLAVALACSPDYIWQIATGRRHASHKLAKAIEMATHSAVTRYQLRADIFGAAPASSEAA